jgi:hypothetical protein
VPRIVFVLSPYQNAFFVELADALTAALVGAGVQTLTITEPGEHPVGDDDVFVLLPPHEYVALEGMAFVDDPAVAARTIGMSAEQPHQSFFERNAALGARLGAVIDFSALAVDAYRSAGVDARHLRFGYVPGWDRYEWSRAGAPTRVLYLGNKQPRRLAALASAAEAFTRHDSQLLISDNDEPNLATSATFVAGDDKRDLLASTRLLVNIHQSDEPYFEWLRFVEAAHCGTAVLSEHSAATDPFVEGRHFLGFAVGELDVRLDEVLADERRLDEVAAEAYDEIRSNPLADSIEVLVTTARELLAAPPPTRLPARVRSAPIGRLRTDPEPSGAWRRSRRTGLLRRAGIGRGDRWALVAPPGTALSSPLGAIVRAAGEPPLTNVLAHGLDDAARPMLEGIWPWQPWRLAHGQHLGRVLVVDRQLHDAALAWMRDPEFADHPHLSVQLFAAVHRIAGGHHASPAARIEGVAVDPGQSIPAHLVDRCRQLLG